MKVIALLFIIVNSTAWAGGGGGDDICVISLTRHFLSLRGGGGGRKQLQPRTLAPLSPAHPRRRVGGQWLQITDMCINEGLDGVY